MIASWPGAYPIPPQCKLSTMPLVRHAALLAGIFLMSQAASASPPAVPLDYPALAASLVRQMALQPGEKVLLLSHPGDFEPIIPLLRQAVVRAGGEIPCGAIRVAPREETVEGIIAFPPGQWGDKDVDGLVLRFAQGKVIEIRARSGQDAVEAELRAGGDAARSFRELALGFNPELAVPAGNPWIPYYGYGAGVVRLSLGDNSELGGTVKGEYVRWNLFTDATVTAGGHVWVRGGKLTP
jgi:hypothetical protein